MLNSSGRFRPSFAFSHWVWALPILLIAATLAIRQIDLYPPTVDEFFSMNDAGWLAEHRWSPGQILESLMMDGPQHTPGYFLLLGAWGSLTTTEVAMGRVLTLFAALLSMAMVYRLAQDFVAPAAGIFVLIVLASNTFANFYYAHTRMYPLLMLLACLTLWLYLRIVTAARKPKALDYAGLLLATYALANIHAFSATFLLTLAVYHIVFAPKNRRWLLTAGVMTCAVMLFAPYALLLLEGYDQFTKARADLITDGVAAIGVWLTLATNNAPTLLLLSIAGMALAYAQSREKPGPVVWLVAPYLLLLALVAETTEAITIGGMRYQLAGMPLFALCVASGLAALHRMRRWLGALALLWLAAGLAFQRQANWWDYLPGRSLAFSQPPTQVLSRMARAAEPTPALLGYPFDSFYAGFALRQGGYINYSQGQHYFDRHGIAIHAGDDFDAVADYARLHALNAPTLWHFYRQPLLGDEQAGQVARLLDELHYSPCARLNIGKDTVVAQYAWTILQCSPPESIATYKSALVDYDIFGWRLDADSRSLQFVDRWNALGGADLSAYNMSWQLIDADWQKAAQLDLPLVNEGALRQFSVDAADAPAGSYRLMLAVYDRDSGERLAWQDEAPGMAALLSVELPLAPDACKSPVIESGTVYVRV